MTSVIQTFTTYNRPSRYRNSYEDELHSVVPQLECLEKYYHYWVLVRWIWDQHFPFRPTYRALIGYISSFSGDCHLRSSAAFEVHRMQIRWEIK